MVFNWNCPRRFRTFPGPSSDRPHSSGRNLILKPAASIQDQPRPISDRVVLIPDHIDPIQDRTVPIKNAINRQEDRIARQTETGDQSGGVASERGLRFGVRMALVDPHNPGGSYLMYKLLRNLRNFEPCPATATSASCALPADPSESAHALLPLPEGELITPSVDELERLREWFVRGDPMPRPRADARPSSIHLQGLRAVARFIASGADCPN
jgi:hypothetical protein